MSNTIGASAILPYPSSIIDNPIDNFMYKTSELLEYGISWNVPGWDIKRMSEKIDKYYNYGYGLAKIPECPASKIVCVGVCSYF